jgi:cell division protein FtsB
LKKYFYNIDKNLFNKRLILLAVFIIIFSFYVGTLLFGKSSLDVLLQLEKQENILKKEIKNLTKSNEKLQKDYFELKNLES